MTDPFPRPDHPESDETIPLVPDSGYADQPSPWSAGYEPTTVDPLTGGYTNPVVSGHSAPLPTPTPPPAPPMAPAPSPYPPPAAPAPAARGFAAAPAYEQPPVGYGSGPYEPARDGFAAPMVPTYSYVYGPPQIEHPNAVPALVLGILGFVVGITFPIAWYLGAKGNAETKREPQRYRPSPMMTVGMVLGIVGTVFIALGVLAMVLFVIIVVGLAA